LQAVRTNGITRKKASDIANGEKPTHTTMAPSWMKKGHTNQIRMIS
jgi:hypothetical protein